VRTRAHRLFEAGKQGKLQHFTLDLARLPELAGIVAEVVRQNYPDLDVPFHARWRHFTVGHEDRWAALAAHANWKTPEPKARKMKARAAFDLAIISVLLDAGAGVAWHYRDARTGSLIGRSEGLALASLDMFAAGAFSADSADPFRADAGKLARLSADDLATGFQVDAQNPLAGLEGRVSLLNALGRTLTNAPEVFAIRDTARPGGLFDHLAGIAAAKGGALPAPSILDAALAHLGAIWPSRLTLGGLPLGDCWHHPLIITEDSTSGLIPFHKLSQWLSYSLIEPLIEAGIPVTAIDGLTGLAEYRNGGLFIDGGVILAKDPAIFQAAHEPGSTVVVEWRALTIALLDEIAPLVRQALDLGQADFPLAKILEGGTWAAGRKLAREARSDGGPPLAIVSDGTVF
jgi:hypothetical protein